MWTPVTSSHVKEIKKDGPDLLVAFLSNDIYKYTGAGDHYNKMLQAPSKGKYLNQFIKGKYEYKKL